jgi:hypothetical protein
LEKLKQNLNNQNTLKIVTTAMLIALGVLLPHIFHFIGQTAGQMFIPMHLPIIVCGFLCGKILGAFCGLVTPYISTLIRGLPPAFPAAFTMSIELAILGAICGFAANRKFRIQWIFVIMISAMILARAASGIITAIIFGARGNPYSFNAFFNAHFVASAVGIAIQLVIIPSVLILLKKTGVLKKYGYT